MKNEEIVRALRCVSTAGGENACEHCPYWKEEEVPEEARPIYGADTWHSCDVDRVGLDGADLIEKLADLCARYAEEIAVAQERTRWVPVEERLPAPPKDKADEIALKLMRLADLESICSYTRLRELAEADKDGRVVVPPCKVGDTVWVTRNPWTGKLLKKPLGAYVNGVKMYSHGLYVNLLFDTRKINGTRDYEINHIGKTVFLTREEAEKALEATKNE